MPVFGADPEAEVSAWSEYEGPTRRYVSKPVSGLTSYFGYHPQMKMSQRFDDEDKVILNAYFSKRLKQGHTDRSIRKMIDRFWQSWGSDTERPAFTFTSTKVQQVLVLEAEIVKDDPVLEWLLDGMPSNGPFEDSNEMRKLVTRHSVEGLFRYPDVVADILRPETGNEGAVLLDLEDAIDHKLAGSDQEVNYRFLQQRSTLPKELTGPGKLRPRHATVQAAIANIPLHKKVQW